MKGTCVNWIVQGLFKPYDLGNDDFDRWIGRLESISGFRTSRVLNHFSTGSITFSLEHSFVVNSYSHDHSPSSPQRWEYSAYRVAQTKSQPTWTIKLSSSSKEDLKISKRRKLRRIRYVTHQHLDRHNEGAQNLFRTSGTMISPLLYSALKLHLGTCGAHSEPNIPSKATIEYIHRPSTSVILSTQR